MKGHRWVCKACVLAFGGAGWSYITVGTLITQACAVCGDTVPGRTMTAVDAGQLEEMAAKRHGRVSWRGEVD